MSNETCAVQLAVDRGDRSVDVTAAVRNAGHGAGVSLLLHHGGCRLCWFAQVQDEDLDAGPAIPVRVERRGDPEANRAEIRERYHAAALRHHPDRGGDAGHHGSGHRALPGRPRGGREILLHAGDAERVLPWFDDSVVVWARLAETRPAAVAYSVLLVSIGTGLDTE